MIINAKMIAATGTLLALAGTAVGVTIRTRLLIGRQKVAKRVPTGEQTDVEIIVPLCSTAKDCNSMIDYLQESSIIEAAWQMAYKRLGESEESGLSEPEQTLLLCEAATDVRYAIDRGTRCVLARNGAKQCPQQLEDRINDCARYMNRSDIQSLHQTRTLCNQIIHSNQVHGDIHNRLLNAAKQPGMLLRLVASYIEAEQAMSLSA